jgi:hypothetical protein
LALTVTQKLLSTLSHLMPNSRPYIALQLISTASFLAL